VVAARTNMGAGKGKGEGRGPPDEPGSKLVRVAGDLAEMLGEIYDVTRVPTAEYLDPLIRPHIEADHKLMRAAIESIKQARGRHRKKEPPGGGG
jgi:hypothetical protein